MNSPLTVPLSQLVAGHEIDPPINVRSAGRDNVADLAANILDRIRHERTALIYPLQAIEGDKPRGKARRYVVSDGNRRLAALRKLAEDGAIDADYPVPIAVGPRVEARETSLTTAVMAAPLHPVDRYEAFVALDQDLAGRTEPERVAIIARRFGLRDKQVRQDLALGALAPEIRAAWRDDKLDRGAAEAFTAEPDLVRQAEILDAMEKGHVYISPHSIRNRILKDQLTTSDDRIALVGLDAYTAAGGMLSGDLFSNIRVLQDRDLFDRLYHQQREAVRDRVAAEGWGLVVWTDDAPETWRWQDHDVPLIWTDEAAAERDRLTAIANGAATGATAAAADEPDNDDDFDEGDGFEDDEYDDEFENPANEDDGAEAATDTADRPLAPWEARCALNDLTRRVFETSIADDDKPGLAAVLAWNGQSIDVRRGKVHPGSPFATAAEGAQATAGTEAPEAEQPASSPLSATRSSAQPLSEIATRAAIATIAGNADLALAVLIAAWLSRSPANPVDKHQDRNKAPLVVDIRPSPFAPAAEALEDLARAERGFADRLAQIMGLNRAGRLGLIAQLVAGAVDMTADTLRADTQAARDRRVSPQGAAALIAAMPKAFRSTAAATLSAEAEALFAGWPKAALVAAIRDMDGDEAAERAAKGKRDSCIALCIERARATAWIPPEWREPAAAEQSEAA